MPLRQQVQDFVSACERIHGFLAGGGRFTQDEVDVLEMAAKELMATIRPDDESAPQWLV